MRDGAVGVDLYNAQVTGEGGGVGDAPPRRLGRRAHPVRDRAYGVSFDIHYGCPALHELAHCVKFGTAPGYLQGVIIEL